MKIAIRYLEARAGRAGSVRFLWNPSPADKRAGWRAVSLKVGAAHSDAITAAGQASWLNAIRDAWAAGDAAAVARLLAEPSCPRVPVRVPGQPAPSDPAARTLSRLWAVYTASPRFGALAPDTRAFYSSHARKLLAWGGEVAVAHITRRQARKLYDALLAARGASTAAGRLRVLSVLLSHAAEEEWDLASPHPTARLRMVTPKGRVSVYAADEVAHLIATADRTGRADLGDAVALAYVTGLRAGDLCRLRADRHVGGEVRVRTSKTGAYISVEIPAGMRARLAEAAMRQRRLHGEPAARFAAAKLRHPERWRAYAAATLLVNDTTGLPFKPDTLTHDFGKLRAEAAKDLPALAGRTFADLRDTAVTRLAEAGCPVGHICAITGHVESRAEALLERHYLARSSAMARAAMERRGALEAGAAHGLF